MCEYSRRPIGVFDSGVGGLTVVKALRKALPQESILYFGDTARLPYGTKGQNTVIRFSLECAGFLEKQGVKLIVVACNTATAWALQAVADQVSVPVVGVIAPAVRLAAAVSQQRHIGVLATQSTILSCAYQQQLLVLNAHLHVHPVACPLFVPLVEEGFSSHLVARLVAEEYLHGLNFSEVDTLLLGCTHYPLLRNVISQVVPAHTQIIDSGDACADEVKNVLIREGMQSSAAHPSLGLYVSDDVERMRALGARILGHPLEQIRLVASEELCSFTAS